MLADEEEDASDDSSIDESLLEDPKVQKLVLKILTRVLKNKKVTRPQEQMRVPESPIRRDLGARVTAGAP